MSNDYKCWGKTKQEIRTRGLGDIRGRMVKQKNAPLIWWHMTRIMLHWASGPDGWNSARKGPGVGVCLASQDLSWGQWLVKNKEACGDLWALLRTVDFYTEWAGRHGGDLEQRRDTNWLNILKGSLWLQSEKQIQTDKKKSRETH